MHQNPPIPTSTLSACSSGFFTSHFPPNFYEGFVLSDLMGLLVMYGSDFCLEKNQVESNLILFLQQFVSNKKFLCFLQGRAPHPHPSK